MTLHELIVATLGLYAIATAIAFAEGVKLQGTFGYRLTVGLWNLGSLVALVWAGWYAS